MKQCFFIILNHSLFCFQFRIRINAYVFRCEIVSPVKPDFHKGTVSRLDAGIIHAILQMPRWPWVVAAGSRQEHVLSGTLTAVTAGWRALLLASCGWSHVPHPQAPSKELPCLWPWVDQRMSLTECSRIILDSDFHSACLTRRPFLMTRPFKESRMIVDLLLLSNGEDAA